MEFIDSKTSVLYKLPDTTLRVKLKIITIFIVPERDIILLSPVLLDTLSGFIDLYEPF